MYRMVLKDNKGSINMAVVVGVLVTIVSAIILVNFVQGSMGSYQSASDDLRRTPCTQVNCFWNVSGDGQCQASATNATLCNNETEYSLAGLYARQTGIWPIVLLATALLVIVLATLAFIRR